MGKTKELWAFNVELIDEIKLGQKPKFVMTIEKIEDMKEDIRKVVERYKIKKTNQNT